jgi:hypothetical protein
MINFRADFSDFCARAALPASQEFVMPALVAGIHIFLRSRDVVTPKKSWMVGRRRP